MLDSTTNPCSGWRCSHRKGADVGGDLSSTSAIAPPSDASRQSSYSTLSPRSWSSGFPRSPPAPTVASGPRRDTRRRWDGSRNSPHPRAPRLPGLRAPPPAGHTGDCRPRVRGPCGASRPAADGSTVHHLLRVILERRGTCREGVADLPVTLRRPRGRATARGVRLGGAATAGPALAVRGVLREFHGCLFGVSSRSPRLPVSSENPLPLKSCSRSPSLCAGGCVAPPLNVASFGEKPAGSTDSSQAAFFGSSLSPSCGAKSSPFGSSASWFLMGHVMSLLRFLD